MEHTRAGLGSCILVITQEEGDACHGLDATLTPKPPQHEAERRQTTVGGQVVKEDRDWPAPGKTADCEIHGGLLVTCAGLNSFP